ncbi:RNA polymerase ECF family sigma subunit [Tamaricihabitans halophyticus]|uniref:RNA polymerase ECF family sigma subunit n=1 Tax=Tamaricihabitans halophyticus TaxID=1262583 RepID=A0A4R2QVY8_9PSEU|nr:sigma-70 family RNA polymerase sigma factor [Tamaricihabitans halophyticus]TCP54262.1 RNA polymerase ECF family sigma subunit [Tamaricihabitans halophyticus]
MSSNRELADLLRPLAPQVLAALLRQHRDFETAEDAVQEALLAAATQWPERGTPDKPLGWLIKVASRRMTDQTRSEQASRQRAERELARTPPAVQLGDSQPSDADDTLILLLLCCHPSLTPSSQLALTLRAVGGLSTAEIARALLTPERSMAQRLSRARQRIRAAGAEFRMPAGPELAERLPVVLHVLYLIFNEGYTTTSGSALYRAELTSEAIRLTRIVHRALPDDGEVAGLLALMLLTDARRPARTGPDSSLVPLSEQDRSQWDRESLQEGLALVERTLARSRVGPYQLQAAIAAVHGEALRAEDTDWPQIVELYGLLEAAAPNPTVTLGRTVAVAMVHGPAEGLRLLEPLAADKRLIRHHRLHAVRAHLLEMAGDNAGAVEAFRLAARLTTSIPEQHYLFGKAASAESASTGNNRAT